VRHLLCLLLGAASLSAHAVDYSLSGFGTIGYARSDQQDFYQRYINQDGGFKRDTLLGAQLNAQFDPEWSATIQAKLAPSTDSDQSVQATLTWAFVSYRPTDDWLLRAGKLRIPFYLNSENADVGTTFVFARLPVEVYSTAATVDFVGASFAKTWQIGEDELILDGYWGMANDASWRFYARDPGYPIPLTPDDEAGEFFVKLKTRSGGLRLSLNYGGNVFLAGIHVADTKPRDSPSLGPLTYVLGPNLGIGDYYIPAADTLKITTTTSHAGANVDLGYGFRTIGEYVRRRNNGSTLAPDSKGYYLSLLKEMGDWTPYLTYASLTTKNRGLYQAVNSAQPLPSPLNAYQREFADTIVVYDQHSWALGTSYLLSSNSLVKAEWSVVQTGIASSFVDAAPGGDSGDLRINVFSLSYSFTF